ncbi:MAG: glycosyltransferase family 9 protein [Pyrinomonadaceae bacterium]
MNSGIKRLLKKSYLVRFAAWLAAFNFIDLLAVVLPTSPLQKGKKRVVFVKVDGIGDYVIWTASFDTLKRMYPETEYERILVGSDKWQGLAASENAFHRQFFVDTDRLISKPFYRFSKMRLIRNLNADIVINARLTRDFLWGDSLVRCCGAPVKIGSSGIENLMTTVQERISDRWYTKLVIPPEKVRHELVSHLEFLSEIETETKNELTLPDISGAGHSGGFDLEPEYAIFCLGAFTADKRWPTIHFAETARFLSEKYRYQIVLCGGPADKYLVDGFAKHFAGNFIDLTGKTTLLELASLIRSAMLVITNDSGPGHIAVATGCPALVLTPGNHVGRFFPYPVGLGVRQTSVLHKMPCFGCGWECIYKDIGDNFPKPCIANISVTDVIAAIPKLLAY